MTDKDNKNMGDEYQFPQDEYVAAEDMQPTYDAYEGEKTETASEAHSDETAQADHSDGEVPQQKPSLLERFPFLQNKRVIVVIGVAVVAIVAFKIMSPSHKTMSVKRQKMTAQQVEAAQQKQQQMALMNRLSRLSKDASSSQGVVNNLQNEVSGLKAALQQSNESNEAMRKAMLVLAQQVQGLSNEVKKATTSPKHIKKLPPSPVLTFHLRAVIPGRAWVMGSNGESDSVTVGSKLKNYGTVESIDPQAGKVTTSSGKTISYDADGD